MVENIITVKNLKSRPYVDMTLLIAREFGAEITESKGTTNQFVICGNQKYLQEGNIKPEFIRKKLR